MKKKNKNKNKNKKTKNKERDIKKIVDESIEKEESDKKLINKINEKRKQFKNEIKNKNNPIDREIEDFYKRRERNEREEKAKAEIFELIKDKLMPREEIERLLKNLKEEQQKNAER